MKTVILLFLFGLFIITVAAEKEMYSTKYDNINIDEILKSDRLVNNYVGCLMEEKPCTSDGNELKKNLPDALETDCASCSDAQKIMAEKMYHYLIDNRIDQWMKLEEKYDPSGNYRNHYLGVDIQSATSAPPSS